MKSTEMILFVSRHLGRLIFNKANRFREKTKPPEARRLCTKAVQGVRRVWNTNETWRCKSCGVKTKNNHEMMTISSSGSEETLRRSDWCELRWPPQRGDDAHLVCSAGWCLVSVSCDRSDRLNPPVFVPAGSGGVYLPRAPPGGELPSGRQATGAEPPEGLRRWERGWALMISSAQM